MNPHTRGLISLFTMPVVILTAALPVFAQTSGGGTASAPDAGGWSAPNITALIAAITGLIVAITGLVRGTSAQAKSDANEQRINAVSTRLDAHGQQITDLAKDMVPPSMLPQMMPTIQPPQGTLPSPPARELPAELNRH